MSDSILGGLERKEVVMHYQPIVDLKTMAIASYEALIRWQHPTRGMLYPDSFIEIAEREPDTIFQIFAFGLESASAAINILELPVSVNLSVVSLTHKDFPSEIGLYQGEAIAFEITERASMASASAKQLERLVLVDRLGFTVLVDDFTAASFNHLSAILGAFNDLERVKVKLDMHLIKNLSKPHMKTIIKAIVTCAHEMGIKVICEGVETEEQVDFLRGIGCDYAQGYLFGKPKALPK